MRLLLKHAAASLAAFGIAFAALVPLITIPPAEVASLTLPTLA